MIVNADAPARPVICYHGGKWKLAKWIIGYFPEHRIYVEPFGGAASVLLQKPRCYAEVYNDLDCEIVNLFRVLRNPSQAAILKYQLEMTPFARDEFDLSYLTDRDPIELARRTVIRSFMGFGSAAASGHQTGFRSNSNRRGTTPAHDWAHYPSILPSIVKRLQGIVIENRPAIDIMLQHDQADCLHYVDPPYVRSTRTTVHDGYRFEMSDAQHQELAATLKTLRGMVILSGYTCPLYDDLYGDWKRIDHLALADGAKKRTESLWFNGAAYQGQQQLPLFGQAEDR